MKIYVFTLILLQAIFSYGMELNNNILALLDNEKEIPYTVYTFQEDRIPLPDQTEKQLIQLILQKQNTLLKNRLNNLNEELSHFTSNLTPQPPILKETPKLIEDSVLIESAPKKMNPLAVLPPTQSFDKQNVIHYLENTLKKRTQRKKTHCTNKKQKPILQTPQDVQRAILASKRALMKRYQVQKERDLKNRMREQCEQEDRCMLNGIINNYTWCYYKHCNDLEIYVDDTSSSGSSTEID